MEYEFSDRLRNLGGNAIRDIFKLLSQPDIISFAGGFPYVGALPLEKVRSYAEKVLSASDAAAILQYGATEGYYKLREESIEHLKRYGIDGIDVDNLLIVSGGQQTIDLMFKAFLNKGDVVLVENPTYLACLHICKTYEAVAVGVNSGDEGLDLADLEAKILAYKPKLLYIVPTFSNPTGRTLSVEKRKAICEMTAKYGVMVLEDDPYSELRYEGERVPSMKSFDKTGNVVYTKSFSKIIGGGLRVGIAVGDKTVIRKLTIGKQATDVHTSAISQAIVAEYLSQNVLDDEIDRIIPMYREKRDIMLDSIAKYFPKQVKYTHPMGGLFIWCELPDIDTQECFSALVERKVAYVSGVSFFADGATRNCLRLNFSNATNEQIQHGIAVMGEYFKEIITNKE